MDLREKTVADPDNHWYFSSKLTIIRTAMSNVSPRGFSKLLDFGAGDGFYSSRLQGEGVIKSLIQYDPNYSRRELSSSRRVNSLSAIDGSCFDAILLMDVLEHVPDPASLLGEITQFISDSGHLFITVPARMELWSSHDELLEHYKRYDEATLRAELVLAGWHVERLEYRLSWMYALALITKRLFRYKNRAEMTLPSILNALFKFLVKLDFVCPWKRNRGITILAVASPIAR